MIELWKRVDPTEVTKVGWRTVVTKTFVMNDGKTATFDTFGKEDQEFVAVVGLTPENKAIIARQFRIGPEKIMDELPGGFVDAGEDLEAAARREFREETGYTTGEMIYLGGYSKDAYLNATWHVFLAKDCIKTAEQELDAGEDIEIDLISIEALIDNAKNNNMSDGVAVFKAYDELIALI